MMKNIFFDLSQPLALICVFNVWKWYFFWWLHNYLWC